MEVGTIDGRDWGLDFNSGKTTALGYSFLYGGVATHRGVVFIDAAGGMGYGFEINVVVQLTPDDMDSTDLNPFRQYARRVTDLLDAIACMNDISADAFRASRVGQVDKHLVIDLKFHRVI